MKKAMRAQKAENSALTKKVAELERTITKLSKRGAEATAQRATAVTAAVKATDGQAPEMAMIRASFSADGFAKLRKSWTLSAQAMGALIGASGQSVYKWETKGVMPRDKQLASIWEIKDLSKEQAMARLAQLQAA